MQQREKYVLLVLWMKACTNRASRIICQTKVIFYFHLLSFNMQIHWEIGSPLEPASSGHSRNCNLCHFRVDFIVAAWLELVCTHTTLAEVWRSLNWKSHSHLQKRTFVTSLLSPSPSYNWCWFVPHPQHDSATSISPPSTKNSTITVN